MRYDFMEWIEGSILNSYTAYTPCKEIFRAVTDELAKHYSSRGFKYYTSHPKLVYSDKDIKLEICFGTSRYNGKGGTVILNISPLFYAARLKSMENNGVMLSLWHIYAKWSNGRSERLVMDRFNVYGLTVKDFENIVSLIDNFILIWLEKLKTPEGVSEMLLNVQNCPRPNPVFLEYVKMYFPQLLND
jgi:hypothetical protein